MKKRFTSLTEFLLKKLRWVIVLIGLILSAILALYVRPYNSSSPGDSLLLNLIATALAISFTAFLIDWLQERRQRLLIAKPLKLAKHELNSVRFAFSMTLGPHYLGSNYPKVLQNALKNDLSDMTTLAKVSTSVFDELSKLTPQDYPSTNNDLAASLTKSLSERIASIDEVLMLYGFALDTDLRDRVHLLRDRIVSLRNVLDSFGLNNGLQNESEMQKLVALQVQSLVEAIQRLDVEWTEAGEIK